MSSPRKAPPGPAFRRPGGCCSSPRGRPGSLRSRRPSRWRLARPVAGLFARRRCGLAIAEDASRAYDYTVEGQHGRRHFQRHGRSSASGNLGALAPNPVMEGKVGPVQTFRRRRSDIGNRYRRPGRSSSIPVKYLGPRSAAASIWRTSKPEASSSGAPARIRWTFRFHDDQHGTAIARLRRA